MPTYLSPNSDITINDDGNMGFGTGDIEAWHSLFRAIQLSDQCAIAWKVAGQVIYLAINAYATDEFEWRYREDGNAMLFTLEEDFYSFRRSTSSGVANDVISWTTAMNSAVGQTFVGDSGTGLAGLSVQIGSIASAFQVGGVWNTNVTTSVGNVGSGEDPLATYALPASLLGNIGECLIFDFYGTIANNANAKTLRFKFGAAGTNQVFSRVMTPSVARGWHLRAEVYRTGSATQISFATIHEGTASEIQIVTTLNQTMNAAITATLTGEAVANNDIVMLTKHVRWQPRGA